MQAGMVEKEDDKEKAVMNSHPELFTHIDFSQSTQPWILVPFSELTFSTWRLRLLCFQNAACTPHDIPVPEELHQSCQWVFSFLIVLFASRVWVQLAEHTKTDSSGVWDCLIHRGYLDKSMQTAILRPRWIKNPDCTKLMTMWFTGSAQVLTKQTK